MPMENILSKPPRAHSEGWSLSLSSRARDRFVLFLSNISLVDHTAWTLSMPQDVALSLFGISCGHLSNNGLGVFLNLGFPEVNSDMNIRVKEIYLRMILGNLVRMWGGVGGAMPG